MDTSAKQLKLAGKSSPFYLEEFSKKRAFLYQRAEFFPLQCRGTNLCCSASFSCTKDRKLPKCGESHFSKSFMSKIFM